MRRFLSLLKLMMLAVLLWTGNVAHAEEVECSAPAAIDASHVDQSPQDEAPSDPGKAAQHQHTGCHGHHVANASSGLAEPAYLASAQPKSGRVTPAGAGASPDSALRPPIA
jgi:hypothetical protein